MAQNEAEKLKVQQEIVKAKADPEYLRHQLLSGEGLRLRNTVLKLY